MKKIFLFVLSIFCFKAFSQSVQVTYNGSGNYVYIERTDLRRYDNGKYTGLVSREVRSYITQDANPAGAPVTDTYYDGNFYFNENTIHNSRAVLAGLNTSIPSRFKITGDGELVMIEDHGFPSFRSFPSFPKDKIKPGDKWQAKAERVVDPLNKGINTKLPIYVEYTYLKDDVFHGEDVYVFYAQWATRYGITQIDYNGDRELKAAQGSHKATINVSKRTGNALVVRDTVDETFAYMDGSQVAFKGTISLFTEYPPAFDRSKIYQALERMAGVDKNELKLAKKQKEEGASDSLNKAKSNAGSQQGAANQSVAGSQQGAAIKTEDRTKTSAETRSSHGDMPEGFMPPPPKDNSLKAAPSKPAPEKNTPPKPAPTKEEKRRQLAENIKSQGAGNTSGTGESAGDGAGFGAEKKVSVEATEAGIRLTIQNLQFKPDSAELLPGENDRLDQIASVLKQAPGQMFLVEGHTAAVGYPAGEQKLSEERAASIVQSLIKRGIPSQQFIVKGSGSTKPVADNSTREGKAKNRRVEITILD